jgi:plasmid stability protein
VSFAEVRELVTPHVLAEAFSAPELFEVEHALARAFFAHARSHDAALAAYLTQLVDIENAQAALALSARGGDLDADPLFLAGGNRIDRALFRAAATSPATTHEQLARAFTGTPLATAMFAARPAAIEDAALAWQLATQIQLRRLDPLGLAPVLWLVLRRREETRRLRARAWSAALGGPP